MAEENKQLAVLPKPGELMTMAAHVAGVCKEIVGKTAITIQGRKYVKVEGWQAIAVAHGCFAGAGESERVYDDSGELIGWKANGYIRNGQGVTIGTGEGFVGLDEVDRDGEQTWGSRAEYACRAMAQCVSLDAEILTRRGFQKYHKAEKGEAVLGYDLESDETRWVPLEAINVFSESEVIRVQNRSFDSTFTPNHSWVFQDEYGNRQLLPWNAPRRRGSIIHAAACSEGWHPLTPADAYLIGWILTDGCIRRDGGSVRIYIDQSKREQVKKLIEATKRVEAKMKVTPAREQTFFTGRTYHLLPAHRFTLNAKQSRQLLDAAGIHDKLDKNILALVCALTPEARAAMWTAMIEADGSLKPSGNRGTFGKKNLVIMEAFQLLCALNGVATGRMTDYEGMPRQTFRSHRVSYVPSLRSEEAARQPVWCPTTLLGTWVMRHNGVISITGNTRATSRAARSVFAHIVVMMNAGLETVPAEEVNEQTGEPESDRSGNKSTTEPIYDWRDVKVHWSKHKGKQLGELSSASLEWFQKWEPQPYNGRISAADRRLRRALNISLGKEPPDIKPADKPETATAEVTQAEIPLDAKKADASEPPA